MKPRHLTTLALAIGATAGATGHWLLTQRASPSAHTQAAQPETRDKPLYWVAPMDPSYQRDKPGKSPMGMDLIPVYAPAADNHNPAGTVTIDPALENNLGVKVAQAQMAPLAPNIDTVGYVAFDQSQLWQVNVRVAGWVETLNVHAVGEHVSQGDVLFTLYSPELVKAQEELLSAYRSARSSLISGASERLISLGVDRAQIQAILQRGKPSPSIEVKAKADGIIASLNVREGGYLAPAQTALSGGPLDTVWVDAEVFERQATWVNVGSQAQMTLDAMPGKTWHGTIDYVYPIVDPQTRTLRLRLKFTNPDGDLKPNMFANLSLQPVTTQSVLTIPKSAVIRSAGMTRVVLAQGNGKYRSVRIDIGREAGEQIEVLQGLSANDRVVTSAQFLLDSESSQSADLARINGLDSPAPSSKTSDSALASEVWAEGEITMLMADFGMVTLRHQPISAWQWPRGEMSFTLAPEVSLTGYQLGDQVRFLIHRQDQTWSLTRIERLGGKQ